MTIPTEVAQLKIETDGTNDPIDLTSEFGALYYLNPADVVVFYRDPDGNETQWFLGDDYTLSGNGHAGDGVLTPIAATEAGGHICVFRLTPLVQDLDLNENDGFPAEALERAQDRQIIIDQDTRRMVLASVRGCVCDPPMAELPCAEVRANKCLHFDEEGNPIAVDCGGTVVQMTLELDGLGAAIAAGTRRRTFIAFACEVTGWSLQTDQNASVAIDVRMKPYVENNPPGAGNSIVAAAPPALVNGREKYSTAIETWSRVVPALTSVEFEVLSNNAATWLTLNIMLRR